MTKQRPPRSSPVIAQVSSLHQAVSAQAKFLLAGELAAARDADLERERRGESFAAAGERERERWPGERPRAGERERERRAESPSGATRT